MKKFLLGILIVGLAGFGLVHLQTRSAKKSKSRQRNPATVEPLTLRWPPILGELYPDLILLDQTGNQVRLSSFKGSVILVEPVGMNCPACQGFSGAGRKGPYGSVTPQQGLGSIEAYLPSYGGGLSVHDPRLVFALQMLLDVREFYSSQFRSRALVSHKSAPVQMTASIENHALA